jgi:hypothetical protein
MAHEDRHHDELGGSTAHRWLICWGSVAAARQHPKPDVGPAAIEGTMMHGHCEAATKLKLDYHKNGGSSEAWLKYIADAPIALDKKEIVTQYVLFIWEKVFEQSVTQKAWGLETYYKFTKAPNAGGSIDLWLVHTDDHGKKVLSIVDYKNGFGGVRVKNNPQIIFYALCVRQYLQKFGKDIDYCLGYVYQPHSEFGLDEEPCKYTKKQLDTWETKFVAAAAHIYGDKILKFKAGDHCKYCNIDGTCLTQAAYAQKMSALTVMTSSKDLVLPDVTVMSDEALAKIALNGDLIVDLIASAKAQIIDRHKMGKSVEFCKVIAGKGKRMWKDDEAAIIAGLKQLGVAEPTREVLQTISVIKKQIGDEALQEFVEMSNANPKVVPVDHPEPAMDLVKLDVLKE